jgi:hypothetical protein
LPIVTPPPLRHYAISPFRCHFRFDADSIAIFRQPMSRRFSHSFHLPSLSIFPPLRQLLRHADAAIAFFHATPLPPLPFSPLIICVFAAADDIFDADIFDFRFRLPPFSYSISRQRAAPMRAGAAPRCPL